MKVPLIQLCWCNEDNDGIVKWFPANVLVVQCGPLKIQTSKQTNLWIWSAWDGMVATKKPRWRLFLDRVQSGTHNRCISQSSICIATFGKTMLIYLCTQCMYCCSDPTTQRNKLSPIWYLQSKLGFRRNSFMSLRPWHVCLLGPCLVGLIHHQILRQQCCRTVIFKANLNP